MLSPFFVIGQNKSNSTQDYINTYTKIAIEQEKQYGIPACITLAQGILESGSGRSRLATEANNHFGIKCHNDWKGKKIYKDDDKQNECFRVYDNAEQSYIDHSLFLVGKKRYAELFKLKITDYKGWAKGLKKAGYAEDREYPQKLIGLIEKYNLQKFDHYSMADVKGDLQRFSAQEKSNGKAVMRINGLLYVKAGEGDTFASLSRTFDISKRKLRKYNDMYKRYKLKPGDIIYLEKKRNRAARGNKYHTTEPGESLYDISQKYGVKLKRIYKMNPAYENYAKLKVGDIVRLR